ncbi:mechanosensitive ion channel domain-containing protein [Acidicapsa ligni]|uniref:mechanosensitive ion channel domain-containing protein n=1 Tax=Acidicapsa ligni TaxID=542300 RepID=UPI0021DF555B|nr:mechanosensitive ion channel family protein [Acidicapsa ligni]
MPRHFQRGDTRYHVRKFLIFSGYITVIFLLILIFEDRLWKASIAFGFAGAGVVVALQDVIASIAGWFAIGLSRLFSVGDRIQIADIKGDVIDISILRTTLMEMGNWVNRDLYNGRIVRIPNSVVLKGQVFNYSQGFPFVWDEIRIQLSSSSDHDLARDLLLRAVREAVQDYLPEAQKSWQRVTDNYRIKNSQLEPTVMLSVTGGNLDFSLSYVVDYAKRDVMKDKIFADIVGNIIRSEGKLKWPASSTIVNVNKSPEPTPPQTNFLA